MTLLPEYAPDYAKETATWLGFNLESGRKPSPGAARLKTVSDLTTPVLIDYLLARYHDGLRAQFPKVIAAARTLERLHDDHPHCPHGLANLLTVLADELGEHIDKEQDDLFPSMLHSPRHNLRFPIDRRRAEHEDFLDQLDTLQRLTQDFTPPAHCGSAWTALYDLCRRLNADVRQHILFEDDILFPRFEARAA